MCTLSIKEQAEEYVARVGVPEARNSVHYRTGKQLCGCGTCFCCQVVRAVSKAYAQKRSQGGAS